MPRGQKNQSIKQKQYCNKLNKDIKNGKHPKKYLKEKKEKLKGESNNVSFLKNTLSNIFLDAYRF